MRKISKWEIKVAVTKSQKPVIEIPPGKMIEYYLDLPRRSVLKFSLFNSMALRKESEMPLAVYSEGGEKKLLGYESGDIGERKDYEVKLNQYSGETVKIVFSNSGGNDPKFNDLHTMDPHYPYNPTKPFHKFKIVDKERDQLPLKKVVLRKWERGWSKEDIDYLFSLYDCEIYQNDFYFNKWINFLKKKGLYENSLIIFIPGQSNLTSIISYKIWKNMPTKKKEKSIIITRIPRPFVFLEPLDTSNNFNVLNS